MLDVDERCDIKTFVQKNGLIFKTGRGFFEFTKLEKVSNKKEVVLVDKVIIRSCVSVCKKCYILSVKIVMHLLNPENACQSRNCILKAHNLDIVLDIVHISTVVVRSYRAHTCILCQACVCLSEDGYV